MADGHWGAPQKDPLLLSPNLTLRSLLSSASCGVESGEMGWEAFAKLPGAVCLQLAPAFPHLRVMCADLSLPVTFCSSPLPPDS